MKEKVLIVGGVAGGASAAARLRRLNEEDEIIIFEKGEYVSFANCGLPYYIGGEITSKMSLTLMSPRGFKSRFNVDVRTFNEVIAIDKDKKEVKVKDLTKDEVYIESYDKLILSPGAEPIKPSIPGIDSSKVFTLRNIPDTYKIKDYIDNNKPKSAIVVGGGFIGIEMTENLINAGLDVTLIEMADQVLSPFDYDMACFVRNELESKGVKIKLSEGVTDIQEHNGYLSVVTTQDTINTDMLIMSIGVKPESKIAIDAGLKVNNRGAIVVNDYMQTSDPNIYAVGDAVEVKDFITNDLTVVPLAGPANKQGRIVADNLRGVKTTYNGTQGSAILKVFSKTAASTGINEKTAKRNNIDYDKHFVILANHATYYPGASDMTIKTIFEKSTGKLLGAQIFGGDGVDKRIDVLATVIRFGGTVYDLTELELSYAPPYGSAKDPVNMVGFVAENMLEGLTKQFHWHDIENLPKDGSVMLVDTRTRSEFRAYHIDGFINIPVDSIRERIAEFDKTKKIYIMCHVGIRGHVACRLLSNLGYDCYNLSGGIEVYGNITRGENLKSGL